MESETSGTDYYPALEFLNKQRLYNRKITYFPHTTDSTVGLGKS
jgi:hypothetical protein